MILLLAFSGKTVRDWRNSGFLGTRVEKHCYCKLIQVDDSSRNVLLWNLHRTQIFGLTQLEDPFYNYFPRLVLLSLDLEANLCSLKVLEVASCWQNCWELLSPTFFFVSSLISKVQICFSFVFNWWKISYHLKFERD